MVDTKKDTGRQARQASEELNETAERTTRGAARRADETAEEAQGALAETAHRIEQLGERQSENMKRTARVANEATQRLAAGTAAGAEALARSSQAFAQGMQEVGRVWVELAQDTMKQGIETTETMLRCRTWSDIVQVQGEYVRQSVDNLLEKSARISDISARFLGEAAEPLSMLAGRAEEEHGRHRTQR